MMHSVRFVRVTCGRSAVPCWYPDFLHQLTEPYMTNIHDIVENSVREPIIVNIIHTLITGTIILFKYERNIMQKKKFH